MALYVFSLLCVLIGIIIDQYTKYLAVQYLQDAPYVIWEDVFELHYLENRGAAFGMLQNQQTFFLIITMITLIAITVLYIRMPKQKHFIPFQICLVSIVTGAIGNLIDRVRLGYVVDFFYFKLINFPIFNVADIFATVACFLLIFLVMFFYSDKDFDIMFQAMTLKKQQE